MPVNIPAVRLVPVHRAQGGSTYQVEYYWRTVPFDSFFAEKKSGIRTYFGERAGDQQQQVLARFYYFPNGPLFHYEANTAHKITTSVSLTGSTVSYESHDCKMFFNGNEMTQMPCRNRIPHGLKLRYSERGASRIQLWIRGLRHGTNLMQLSRVWFWKGRQLAIGKGQEQYRDMLPVADQLVRVVPRGVAIRIVQFT